MAAYSGPHDPAGSRNRLRTVRRPRKQASPLESLWESARPRRVRGVELDLDRSGTVPRYEVGDPLRIGFSVQRDAAVVLLARRPGGAVSQYFPNRRRSSPRVGANERVMVPGAGQGYLRVSGPLGRHALRLLVYPPNVDPLEPDADRERSLAVEREFAVVGRRGG